MSPPGCPVQDQLQLAFELFDKDKVLQSNNLVLELEQFLQEAAPSEEVLELQKCIKTDPRVLAIKAEAERVSRLRHMLSTDETWTVTSVTQSGVRTLFRDDEQTHPFHLFRVEGYVDGPLLHLLAILCEIDLWPNWMIPQSWVCGLREARILGHASPTHFLCYLGAKMPWPVADRDLPLEVKAVDCMDAEEHGRRQIVVLLNSSECFPGIDVPEANGYFRAQLKPSGILLTPEIPEDGGPIRRTHVQLVVCVNPKVVFLPAWVLNMFMRNLVFLFVPTLRKQVPEVSRVDSIYRERVAMNPELYGHLAMRMKECFPSEPTWPWPDA